MSGLIVILVLLIFVLLFLVWLSYQKRLSDADISYIRNRWNEVVRLFDIDQKTAIIDADKILDFVLKKKGYRGTLGEKLKKAASEFSDLGGIWFAHKLRNRIAHELTSISANDAKMALRQFKIALKDLGIKL